jgi:hypothetical protein
MPFLKTGAYRILIVILCFAGTRVCFAQAPTYEYQIKAAFIFNFSQFVSWPDSTFSSDTDPIIIAVVGKNPFGNYLPELIQGEKSGNHPLVFKHYKDIADIGPCHILYVSREKDFAEIREWAADKSILTITDSKQPMQGEIIKLVFENKKIRFEVNSKAAREVDLSLSSKLLRLAKIIE